MVPLINCGWQLPAMTAGQFPICFGLLGDLALDSLVSRVLETTFFFYMYLIWLFCFRQEIESSLAYPNLFRSDEEQLFNTALCVCRGGWCAGQRSMSKDLSIFLFLHSPSRWGCLVNECQEYQDHRHVQKKRGGGYMQSKAPDWLNYLPSLNTEFLEMIKQGLNIHESCDHH